MHSLSHTEWHACPGNVHINGAFNCILNVSVSDGVTGPSSVFGKWYGQ